MMTVQTLNNQIDVLEKAPKYMLLAEGAAILFFSAFLYHSYSFAWWQFALFLLAPDLTGIFYPINNRLFTAAYNLAHTLIFPIGLIGISLFAGSDLGTQIALIWLAHIGLDRAVGYGLKYPGHFNQTHLSRI